MNYNVLYADRRSGEVKEFRNINNRNLIGLEQAEKWNRIQILMVNTSSSQGGVIHE